MHSRTVLIPMNFRVIETLLSEVFYLLNSKLSGKRKRGLRFKHMPKAYFFSADWGGGPLGHPFGYATAVVY